MNKDALADIAKRMMAPGKGLLAADESTGTIKKRFDNINLPSTEENRRNWREALFRTEKAMTERISGVILYDETIRQKAADGTTLVQLIENAGSIPGIKVDMGAKPLAGYPGETITEGLTGLRERLEEYYALGARFAKWRAVIEIDIDGRPTPSDYAMAANMHALGRYAALCQEAGIVPIVEPEVLMGGAHNSAKCAEVTAKGLDLLYKELAAARVYLPGTILKPNMVICGKKASNRATPDQVAENTLKVLRAHVPADVAGIAFLSGGQTSEEATLHLDLMNKIGGNPWPLTYSYGRALQKEALLAWGGSNVEAAQAAFNHRALVNGLAQLGQYEESMEAKAA